MIKLLKKNLQSDISDTAVTLKLCQDHKTLYEWAKFTKGRCH